MGKLEKNDHNNEIVKTCHEFIEAADESISGVDFTNENQTCLDCLDIVRDTFKMLSIEIRGLNSSKILVDPLSDLLFMYSRFETYFTCTDYQRYESKQIQIRKCDVAGAGKPTLNEKGELVLD